LCREIVEHVIFTFVISCFLKVLGDSPRNGNRVIGDELNFWTYSAVLASQIVRRFRCPDPRSQARSQLSSLS